MSPVSTLHQTPWSFALSALDVELLSIDLSVPPVGSPCAGTSARSGDPLNSLSISDPVGFLIAAVAEQAPRTHRLPLVLVGGCPPGCS